MSEVTPRLLFFGFIMFTLVIFCGIYIMGEYSASNSDYINNEKFIGFNRSFNKISELTASTAQLEESITEAETDWGVFGVINSLIKSVWNAFTNMFNTVSFMNDAMYGLSSVFGVPEQIIGLFISLMIVTIAFTIYSLVFAGRT